MTAVDAETIKHLRIDGLDDDDLVNLNLQAAEEDIENEINYPIVACQMTGYQCDWSVVRVPCYPTYRGGVVVKYYDTTDTLQTLDATLYRVLVDGVWVKITFKAGVPSLFDREDAVIVTFDAGFEDATAVTPLYRQAILTRAASKYADREEIAEKWKKAADSMLTKLRVLNA